MIKTYNQFQKRVRAIVSLVAGIFLVTSCHDHSYVMSKGQVTFSFNAAGKQSGGGRVDDVIPATVVVSVHDANGKAVLEHYKITLNSFGDGYISSPVVFDVTSQQKLYLSEFLVMNKDESVVYATPYRGSELAHLIDNPLDIEFMVNANEVTPVIPEVLPVNDSSPADFGYAEFGLNIIANIDIVFSAFIQSAGGFILTNGHLKVEGLADSTSTSPAVLWTYETDLTATANPVKLKVTPAYRITVIKEGYNTWQAVKGLKTDAKLEAFLTQVSDLDIYTTGLDSKAKYASWKNGVRMTTGQPDFSPAGIYVHNGDVYLPGTMPGVTNAFYMKNDIRIDLPFDGNTSNIFFSGNDLYVTGSYQVEGQSLKRPFYIKNGVRTNLPVLSTDKDTFISDIAVAGSDIYFIGDEISPRPAGAYLTPTHPLIWKNGEVMSLPYSGDYALPVGVKINNGHVYVGGWKQTNIYSADSDKQLGYWKDNEFIQLTSNGVSSATGLDVTDSGDVFVTSGDRRYWKNGEEISIPGDRVNLYNIGVVDGKVCLTGSLFVPKGAGKQLISAWWVDGEIFYFDEFVFVRHMQVVKR